MKYVYVLWQEQYEDYKELVGVFSEKELAEEYARKHSRMVVWWVEKKKFYE